jgi:hypothetical protein
LQVERRRVVLNAVVEELDRVDLLIDVVRTAVVQDELEIRIALDRADAAPSTRVIA